MSYMYVLNPVHLSPEYSEISMNRPVQNPIEPKHRVSNQNI